LRTIDQAIRHALQKIDATDPVLRNKIYQATWQTHEKMLASLGHVAEEERQQRRESLKKIIQTIETEFQAPVDPVPTLTPTTVPNLDVGKISPSVETGGLRAEMRGARAPVPSRGDDVTLPQKKSLFRGNGFLLVLVIILIFVGWLFYHSLINSEPSADSENAAPNSVAELIEQTDSASSTLPVRQEEAPPSPQRDWISILNPTDIENVRTRGGATVQLHEQGGERFMRFYAKGVGDEIVIEMGAGLMNRARAKGAIFNIIARSATGELVQLSVGCDIGNMESCGRWRFELPPMREDLLFGVDNLNPQQSQETLTLVLAVSSAASELAVGATDYQVDIFGLEVSFDE